MIKNYFKIAWRNLWKNKVLSIINLFSLSIGIASVLLIAIYINNEYKFDNFHKNESNLYRVGFQFFQSGKLIGSDAQFISDFGSDAKVELPEIESFVRISSEREAYISSGNKAFNLKNIHHADQGFFDVLTYNLLKGNPNTVLKEPFSIVLTETIAKKLFGNEEAIGKTIKINNSSEYLVTGIAQDTPPNSHIKYNALLSFKTLYKEPGNYLGWNGGNQYITYLLLKNGTNPDVLQNKFPDFMWKHINEKNESIGFKTVASLQPIKDLHLYYNNNSKTLRTNIYIFSIVALLILVISSINYINLTTAQSVTRIKEIGVRKILGANKRQIVKQFLGETLLISAISGLFAIMLVAFLLPAYERLLDTSLSLNDSEILQALLFLFIFILLVSTIAGSYRAFYLTSFNISETFKANFPKFSSSFNFKKGLIVVQFVITIGLIASTLFISMQMQFIKTKNQGFNKEQILILPLIGSNAQKGYTLLKQKLLELPEIKNVTGVSEVPYNGITQNGFRPEKSKQIMMIHQLDVDESFLKTFDINLVSGSFFSKESLSYKNGYVINEALAKSLGWKNPIGKTIHRDGDHKVIGVVQDFNFAALHDEIEPLIITNQPFDDYYSALVVKYYVGESLNLIDKTEELWSSLLAKTPFDYWFLDDAFSTVYKSEKRFQNIFYYFSSLSIILSLVGIFGLVLLMLKRRTKEMGIRKILGANMLNITKIVVTDFIWLVLLAAIISIPLTWYYINSWLQNFAYHIKIKWWVFIITALIVLLIVVLTIGIHVIKTSIKNPAESLRRE
ncbi:ABC transporter permease [uncultured Formosa sp.]|uniref:ABC transporter permease n=1 Tax=uncultured Formosa sp. TaxID=255435 RepID=UPI00262D04BC|nr:ABC transporter permease [uncultured Formosa sp.]